MSDTAVMQYLQTAPLDKLGVLEDIILRRREAAEIDAAIDRGIRNFDSNRYVSSAEFVRRTDKYISTKTKG